MSDPNGMPRFLRREPPVIEDARRAMPEDAPQNAANPAEYGVRQDELLDRLKIFVHETVADMYSGRRDVEHLASEINKLRFNAMMMAAGEVAKLLNDKVPAAELAQALSTWSEEILKAIQNDSV